MKIFSVLARKGGVGKSLVVRSLAIQALLDGKKAAILDADPQETIVSWSRRRQLTAPFILGLGSRPMRDALRELEERGGDIAFIDTPPHAQPTINIAAELAHVCLLVTGPYPEDLEQVGAVASIVSSLSRSAGIILNKSPPKTHALTLARAALTTFKIPTCPTSITQLVGHPYASAEGLAIQEREPDSKGAREVAAVWEWVKAIQAPVSHEDTVTPSHRPMTSTRRSRVA